MTTEEKAKAYDNIIERVTELYETGTPLTMEQMEHLFPELHKSKGERIRKELIFFLKEEITQCSIKEHAEKLKEFVAYLEKQKEENHDGKKWIYEDEYRKGLYRSFNDGMDEVLENPGKYGFQKEGKPECDNEAEVQKDTSQEQKQEDEKMLNSVIRIITQFDDLAHEPTFAGPKWTHPYTKELNFLKNLRNRLFEEND